MKVGVVGCTGRMGRSIVKTLLAQDSMQLSGGSCRPGADVLGQDIGLLINGEGMGEKITDDLGQLFSQSEVIIDFTTPETLIDHVRWAEEYKTPLVVGTTGLDENHILKLVELSKLIPLVVDTNMSLGMTLMKKLVAQCAGQLKAEDYDAEIFEMHHRHKKDAPSGSALTLRDMIAQARGEPLDANEPGYHTGPRKQGKIGLSVARGGAVFGEHHVMFLGEEETLTLQHQALSRHAFAKGAVKAAQWVKDQPPGLYSMMDVLEL